MPTPKQTRYHYKKCRKKFYELLNALNEAHTARVINYEQMKNDKGYFVDTLPSVCDAVYQAKENFDIATKNQLAEAFKTEAMNELKGVY